jgi:hypothetical protein
MDRGDHRNLATDQFGRQRGQPIEFIPGVLIYDRHVFALDIAGVLQGLSPRPDRGISRRVSA